MYHAREDGEINGAVAKAAWRACGADVAGAAQIERYTGLDAVVKLVVSCENVLLDCDPLQLYNASVMYLFRGLDYSGYGARLARINQEVRVNTRAVTNGFASCGYVLKTVKAWMFYTIKLQSGRSQLGACEWRVHARDTRALANLDEKTRKYVERLGRKYSALSPSQLEKAVDFCYRETQTWLGKFVSRKLRFIVQSQGLHRNDIENELLYKGLQGLYTMYPRVECKLHAVNVVKRVMHNQGINMIHHYTSQKIGRLQSDSSGAWHIRVVSIDELQFASVAAPEQSDLAVDLSLALYRYTGKRRTFIELLCGAYSERFTAWLGAAGRRVETNEILYERLNTEEYVKLVLRYLNVSFEQGVKFMSELRLRFAAYSLTPGVAQ